ncbi:hypothetical protein D9M73_261900 [compost metagenome]
MNSTGTSCSSVWTLLKAPTITISSITTATTGTEGLLTSSDDVQRFDLIRLAGYESLICHM